MIRHTVLRVCATAIVILALGAFFPTFAQSLRSVIEPRARAFPSVGPGVTSLKRDASGRYYILGKPANVVSIYDSEGKLLGQIPNAKSRTAIRYAVGIDVTPDGKLAVADRGANAIEVFDSDGALLTRISVVAPTSVVALPGNQFAVTSLTSDRLVRVLDDTGYEVRSFGDPADAEDIPSAQSQADMESMEAGKKPLVDWGKIVGSSSGDIYFAFTSLPEPLLRRYDRYGYSGFEASVPKEIFDQRPSSHQDRLEFAMNFSHLSLSDQTVGSFTIGSSGDVKFTGGMGTGLSRLMGSGGSFGRAAAQLSMWQSGNGGAAGGLGGGSIGGMVSGQISRQGAQLQLGAGNISARGGGRGRRGGNFNYDLAPPQGSTLQFFGSPSGDTQAGSAQTGNTQTANADEFDAQTLSFSGSASALQSGSSDDSYSSSNVTDAGQAASLSAAFAYGALFNPVGFPPPGSGAAGGPAGGGIGGLRGPGGFGHGGFEGGGMGHFQGAPFGDGQFRPHHFGAGEGDVSVSMRVNLGDLGSNAAEKATITATAVDPSGDLWAAVGDTLIHYSKDGIPVDVYYLALKGGQPLKPTALLIESDRFLVATDPWGIFEFSRNP